MKKYSKYPTPSHDPQTGMPNPEYPQVACLICCDSNCPYNYKDRREYSETTGWIPMAVPYDGRTKACQVCKKEGMPLYHTDHYMFPEFFRED